RPGRGKVTPQSTISHWPSWPYRFMFMPISPVPPNGRKNRSRSEGVMVSPVVWRIFFKCCAGYCYRLLRQTEFHRTVKLNRFLTANGQFEPDFAIIQLGHPIAATAQIQTLHIRCCNIHVFMVAQIAACTAKIKATDPDHKSRTVALINIFAVGINRAGAADNINASARTTGKLHAGYFHPVAMPRRPMMLPCNGWFLKS